MANQRNGVPAGWHWRDGRPRWIPSKTLRVGGWKGVNLQDGRGAWLGRGPSIAAAQAIVEAVDAWRAGGAVPYAMQAYAPAGATGGSSTPPGGPADPFSIGALIDAYLASDELKTRKDGTPRPASTLRDYTGKLKRLVDALAGFARLPDDTELAAYAAAVAKVRAAPVFILEPVEGPDGMLDPLHKAYWKLHAHAGVHQAFGVMACASAWLKWCHRRKSRRIVNWAADVDRETPPGRIRPLTWPEIAALTASADALGLPEVGDALVLAIDLAWSEVDVLGLVWGRDVAKEQGRWVARGARQKTGRVGGTPFLSMGVRRLAQIRRRQRQMAAQPIKVIHLQRQRQHKARRPEADGDLFRDRFALVRAHAAKACPSVADATFADTRDTGFSLGRQAKLSDDGIASRTRQSSANVKALGDRSYGEIGPEISGPAADALDLHVEAMLKKHGVKL